MFLRLLCFTGKKTIYETYLEQKSGMRILWTEEKEKVLIWYVTTHDKVSRTIGLIDTAESRGGRRLMSETGIAHLRELSPQDPQEQSERIHLDPMGNTPLKIYYVHLEEIPKFKSLSWRPPLYLTDQEQEIVENPHGTVLLLGRSGTGKVSANPCLGTIYPLITR